MLIVQLNQCLIDFAQINQPDCIVILWAVSLFVSCVEINLYSFSSVEFGLINPEIWLPRLAVKEITILYGENNYKIRLVLLLLLFSSCRNCNLNITCLPADFIVLPRFKLALTLLPPLSPVGGSSSSALADTLPAVRPKVKLLHCGGQQYTNVASKTSFI